MSGNPLLPDIDILETFESSWQSAKEIEGQLQRRREIAADFRRHSSHPMDWQDPVVIVRPEPLTSVSIEQTLEILEKEGRLERRARTDNIAEFRLVVLTSH